MKLSFIALLLLLTGCGQAFHNLNPQYGTAPKYGVYGGYQTVNPAWAATSRIYNIDPYGYSNCNSRRR